MFEIVTNDSEPMSSIEFHSVLREIKQKRTNETFARICRFIVPFTEEAEKSRRQLGIPNTRIKAKPRKKKKKKTTDDKKENPSTAKSVNDKNLSFLKFGTVAGVANV